MVPLTNKMYSLYCSNETPYEWTLLAVCTVLLTHSFPSRNPICIGPSPYLRRWHHHPPNGNNNPSSIPLFSPRPTRVVGGAMWFQEELQCSIPAHGKKTVGGWIFKPIFEANSQFGRVAFLSQRLHESHSHLFVIFGCRREFRRGVRQNGENEAHPLSSHNFHPRSSTPSLFPFSPNVRHTP